MITTKFYDQADDARFRYAVIAAFHEGRPVLCRHRDRVTWELPGGHREVGEAILDTARRELKEETGATDFDIAPICAYSVARDGGDETFGMLYRAEVRAFGPLEHEIAEIDTSGGILGPWTYPDIQPLLLEKARGYVVEAVADPDARPAIARQVLEALRDWFGVDESREAYIAQSRDLPTFAAFSGGAPIGFLCLKPTGDATVELAVMGVLQIWHRRGVGRALFDASRAAARAMGFAFMQVKTVAMGRYEDYDRTNRFYQSLGFREFECFPTLWDEANPCQIYVMAL